MPVYDGEHVKYTYNDKNQVSAITTNTTEYTFTYDSYGNTKTIKAGDETLATYNYNPNNGKLQSLVYGNGTTVEYVYDELDRIKEVWYTEGSAETLKYRYAYTADGNLHTVEDLESGEGHMYSYDSEGRMSGYIRYSLSDSTIDTSADYTYDRRSRLDSIDVSFVYTAGTTKTYSYLGYGYTYNDDDALTDLSINLANPGEEKVTLKYTYDNLYRLSGKTYSYQSGYTNTVGYVYKDRGTSYTTGQVSQYSTKVNSNTTTTYTYTYDINGNITQIVDNNGKVTRYYYDDVGQLIREDNPYYNNSVKYTYDNNGNRTAKTTYVYTSGELTGDLYRALQYYGYDDTEWGDRMTSFLGTAMTYDEVGNPLHYNNIYDFTWQNGRELATATTGSKTLSFTYNSDGIRTSKTVDGVKHTYTLNGSQILTEQWDDKLLVFLYDESGSPIGMQYRTNSMAEGTFYTYLFEKNLQGDIIAVYNTSGTKLISYYYDAWGKFVKTTHNLSGTNVGAQYNPFLYRGYYYDTELDFYYLQSRYYDPEVGRFINADGYVSTGQDILGYNMYIYCGNNPINRIDISGTSWRDVVNWFGDLGNTIGNFFTNTFGAGSSISVVIIQSEIEYIPDPFPITVKSGTKTTTSISNYGDSSKPISVYANCDAEHPIKSSTAGIKINISNFTLDISLGLSNIGISGSIRNGNNTDSFGFKANLSEFKVGFEGSSSIKWDNTTETAYTNVNISGWIIAAAFAAVTTGQYIPSPSYMY